MHKYMVGGSMRLFLAGAATLVLAGIWLTGFDKVHWFLYAPVAFFYFAAVTGICPGIIISRMIMGDKSQG